MIAHQYKNKALALLLCLLFLLGMYFYVDRLRHAYHTNNFGTAELVFHYRKAKSEAFCELFDQSFVEVEGVKLKSMACKNYPPLFHWLARPFAFKQETFYLFSLMFICLLVPGILFLMKKHWVIVLFYWGVSFPYLLEMGFHYTQVLATALMLLFIWRKEWWIRIPLILISLLVHSFAPFLLLMVWVIELAFTKKTFFPICTTGVVLKEGKPAVLQGLIKIGKHVMPISNWLNFLIKATPLPFIAFAFKQFWVQKQYWLIALCVAMFLSSILKGRILETMQLVLLLGLTDYYKQADKKMKYGLIILAVLSIALQLLSWRHYRIGTFTSDC